MPKVRTSFELIPLLIIYSVIGILNANNNHLHSTSHMTTCKGLYTFNMYNFSIFCVI